ncbi:MAG: HTTM domain-containing protein [Pirellulales bacterium]
MGDLLKRVFSLDVRSIALMRIAAAAILLWDTCDRMRHLADHYFSDSAIPFEIVEEYYKFFPTWSLHLLSDSNTYQTSLFILQAIAACFLLVGYHSRIAAGICWILFASVLARVPPLLTGGDMLLCSLLFFLALLPCSKCLSVHSKFKAPAGSVYSFATAALLLQFVVMYTVTGIMKINSEWLDGTALMIILSDTGLAKPIGLWLTNFPTILMALTWGSLMLELSAQVLLLSPYKTNQIRTVGVISFIGLHIGIFLTIEVLVFSIISIAGLLSLIPSSWWNYKPLSKLTTAKITSALPVPTAFPKISNAIAAWGLFVFLTVAATSLFTYTTKIYISDKISHVAHQFRFDQRWEMFTQPYGLCYRFVAEVRTADERFVDILRSSEERSNREAVPQDTIKFKSSRWLLLYRQMVSNQYYQQRIPTAEHLLKYNPVVGMPTIEEINGKEVRLLVWVGSPEDRAAKGPAMMTYFDFRATGNYYLGEPHGQWVQRDDQGRITASGKYDQGLREGKWTNYHPNGKTASSGAYSNGLEHGDWTMWDADGVRIAYGPFKDGMMEGTWTFWYENGEVEQAQYIADERITDEPDPLR